MAWEDIPTWIPACAEALVQTIKEKDPHTYYHCLRVGRLSRKLAKALGLNQFECAVLEMSGLLHDIGKVGIPEAILKKPGRLDAAEVDVMKTHSELSAEIIKPLENVPFFRLVVPGVRYHHERVDGAGYPFCMKGDQIPLSARIVSVVDTYDAMSHSRPYRTALPLERVQQELVDFSGRQFDGAIVKVFLEALPTFRLDVPDDVEAAKEEVAVAHIIKAA